MSVLKAFLTLEAPLLPSSHRAENLPVTQDRQALSHLQASACLFTCHVSPPIDRHMAGSFSPPQGPSLASQLYPSLYPIRPLYFLHRTI